MHLREAEPLSDLGLGELFPILTRYRWIDPLALAWIALVCILFILRRDAARDVETDHG